MRGGGEPKTQHGELPANCLSTEAVAQVESPRFLGRRLEEWRRENVERST
ncbi:hypothetical protein H8E88_31215 [candidate division KSB1 bacterium]|nr:hypothetical protein [candidate division KSB1 bacterium]